MSHRVLVVDDDDEIREALCELLTAEGRQAGRVESGFISTADTNVVDAADLRSAYHRPVGSHKPLSPLESVPLKSTTCFAMKISSSSPHHHFLPCPEQFYTAAGRAAD